jgi:hypothetical protein
MILIIGVSFSLGSHIQNGFGVHTASYEIKTWTLLFGV